MVVVIENSQCSSRNGFVALLDLKRGSHISLDGVPITTKTSDIIVFQDVPFDTDQFHLVAIRGATSDSGDKKNISAVTVGFTVLNGSLVKRYDAKTEEVSSSKLDELTVLNLTQQINDQNVPPGNKVTYNQVVSQDQINHWRDSTRFISCRLLGKRGLFDGDKVVPGSYGECEGSADPPKIIDGKAVDFPNIPVLDSANEGLRTCRHLGTRRYLKELSPDIRSSLFLDPSPSSRILHDVLSRYYEGSWEDLLGDLQLAFVLVLNLHCFSSLECWRDLIALLCFVEPEGINSQVDLYLGFIHILTQQVTSMDADLLEVEISEETFMPSCFKRLISSISTPCVTSDNIRSAILSFQRLLTNRFPTIFLDDENRNYDEDMDETMNADMDDDEGPVIVSEEDVAASLARSSHIEGISASSQEIRKTYPLLVAAMQPHEDILMTCARALSDATDVSLVREAASYLENVEQRK